jgi:hypothetical protein
VRSRYLKRDCIPSCPEHGSPPEKCDTDGLVNISGKEKEKELLEKGLLMNTKVKFLQMF